MASSYAGTPTDALRKLLKDDRIAEVAREKIRAELATRNGSEEPEPRRPLQTTARLTANPEPRSGVICAPGDAVSLVLFGPPRTKKTSNQVVFRNGKPKVLPSAAWLAWLDALRATGQLPEREPLPDRPYRCTAIFYRSHTRGDLVGFQQGLADVLEKGGVLSNDKWVTSWDGSRMDVDRACPRVELVLVPI